MPERPVLGAGRRRPVVIAHGSLLGRDEPDQHPVEAIGGLDAWLVGKLIAGSNITLQVDDDGVITISASGGGGGGGSSSGPATAVQAANGSGGFDGSDAFTWDPWHQELSVGTADVPVSTSLRGTFSAAMQSVEFWSSGFGAQLFRFAEDGQFWFGGGEDGELIKASDGTLSLLVQESGGGTKQGLRLTVDGRLGIVRSNGNVEYGDGQALGVDDAGVYQWITPLTAADKGVPGGVAELDGSGLVLVSQLPSFVNDVVEYANVAAFPVTGESGIIYVALDSLRTYRWSGSAYVEISASLALGETSDTAYRGDRGKTAYDHSQATGNPHGTTAADVGAAAAGHNHSGTYLPLVANGASVEDVGAIESNVNTVAATGSTETLDLSLYAFHDCTMDQACTFTFSNPAPSGKATIFTLILRGAFTPTLPASIKWAGGAPTYTTPSQYVFTTVDGGTTYLGQQVGAAFA